jgi:hypothetical protein
MRIVNAALIGLLGIATNTWAATNYTGTGEELARFAAVYEQSRAKGGMTYGGRERVIDIAYYQGFVAGVALSTLDVAWCPNGLFSTDQLWSVVAKFLANNPEYWNQRAELLVRSGLARAFPCNSRSERLKR